MDHMRGNTGLKVVSRHQECAVGGFSGPAVGSMMECSREWTTLGRGGEGGAGAEVGIYYTLPGDRLTCCPHAEDQDYLERVCKFPSGILRSAMDNSTQVT